MENVFGKNLLEQVSDKDEIIDAPWDMVEVRKQDLIELAMNHKRLTMYTFAMFVGYSESVAEAIKKHEKGEEAEDGTQITPKNVDELKGVAKSVDDLINASGSMYEHQLRFIESLGIAEMPTLQSMVDEVLAARLAESQKRMQEQYRKAMAKRESTDGSTDG